MSVESTPDLLSAGRLRRRGAALRQRLDSLAAELTTGRKSDIVGAAGGDLRRLYALEGDLARAETHARTIGLAADRAAATQLRLEGIQASLAGMGPEILAATSRGDMEGGLLFAAGAETAIGAAVSALNAAHGGRALFAGAAVDGVALAPAATLLADVEALIAGAADDVGAAIAAVDAYFDDPAGGFATGVWRGDAADAPAAVTGEGGEIAYSARADDARLKAALKGLALAAAATRGAFAGAPSERLALLDAAGAVLTGAVPGLVALRGEIGAAEGALAAAAARNAGAAAALRLERNALTAADPYETAAAFQAHEAQLDAAYTMTARLSRLSIVNYLR